MGATKTANPALGGISNPLPGIASGLSGISEEVRRELDRETRRRRTTRVIANTIGVFVVVIAAAIIAATFFFSVLQIRGTSMEPNIHEGDMIITTHGTNFDQGDVVAFYFNNRVLLKRVVAFPGDWVDIDDYGTVAVNGQVLQEDYVKDLALGDSDISFPYQVPENRYFVLGDNRSVSIDSRSSAIGTITDEQVIGKVVLRVFPFTTMGVIK